MWRHFAGRNFPLEGFCERLFPAEGFELGGISPLSHYFAFNWMIFQIILLIMDQCDNSYTLSCYF